MPSSIEASYAHCERLLGEQDRDAWLACLFAPQAARPRLHALGAFLVEVGQVQGRVREPLAGELRLQWWEDAILGIARGDASAHPVAMALLDTVAAAELSQQWLIELLDAHRAALHGVAPAGLAALDDHLDRRCGHGLRLAAAILAGPAVDVSGLARHAGVALGLAAALQALPRTAGRGQADLPDEILTRHGLGQNHVRAAVATPPLRAALADLRRHARDHLFALRLARRALPEAAAPAFLTVNLLEDFLRAHENPDIDPFSHHVMVPQWRRQWVLWRAARRGGLR